ncbi:hypothetical protein ACJMK2_015525 [Sinanodonta woodiana]|uniref:Uncharacterized protein n=1 Tax=Sinanodonta woodiana TaxID=1069815 RepID=A0ABD3URW0_SINWO
MTSTNKVALASQLAVKTARPVISSIQQAIRRLRTKATLSTPTAANHQPGTSSEWACV